MFSSNHKQITGDFAEHLTMYWLSKKGIECTHVRHTGIDIIASFGSVRWGISVKARSRKDWQENYGFTINKPYEHIQKVKKACFHFGCKEYFAFILDQKSEVTCYLITLDTVLKHYNPSEKLKSQEWNLKKFIEEKGVSKFNLSWI